MIKNWSFAKITDILQNKLRSVIVSQNHIPNKILDVHPLSNISNYNPLPGYRSLLHLMSSYFQKLLIEICLKKNLDSLNTNLLSFSILSINSSMLLFFGYVVFLQILHLRNF